MDLHAAATRLIEAAIARRKEMSVALGDSGPNDFDKGPSAARGAWRAQRLDLVHGLGGLE